MRTRLCNTAHMSPIKPKIVNICLVTEKFANFGSVGQKPYFSNFMVNIYLIKERKRNIAKKEYARNIP